MAQPWATSHQRLVALFLSVARGEPAQTRGSGVPVIDNTGSRNRIMEASVASRKHDPKTAQGEYGDRQRYGAQQGGAFGE